jgi:uncharacterized protein (TIRG00374 family)
LNGEADKTRSRDASVGRWLRRGGVLLVAVLLFEYFVVPQLVGARAALVVLRTANPWFLAAALLLEACSLMSYTALTRAVLGSEAKPGYWTLLRVDLTGYGVSHVVPGGGATSAALRYRLMTGLGIRGAAAVACAAIEGAAEVCALVLIFAAGLAIALPEPGQHPFVLVAAEVAASVVAILCGVAVLLVWKPVLVRARVYALVARLPDVDARSVDGVVRNLAENARALADNRHRLSRILFWAATNWLLDAACLWVCLRTFGYSEQVGPLLAVYGLVNLVAMLPITPGGLGIVEGVLIPAVVSFGSPRGVAVLGVLTWRLIAFWLPIPLSWLTMASLRASLTTHSEHQHADAGDLHTPQRSRGDERFDVTPAEKAARTVRHDGDPCRADGE